jgi:hypothetical protein
VNTTSVPIPALVLVCPWVFIVLPSSGSLGMSDVYKKAPNIIVFSSSSGLFNIIVMVL